MVVLQHIVICFKIPVSLKQEIQAAIEKGLYINQSDFLREAVRSKLQKLREVSDNVESD